MVTCARADDGSAGFKVSHGAGASDSQGIVAAVPASAHDVKEALAGDGRDLAKTSVITTLNTMVAKKYLKRSRQGNSFLFSPRITQAEVSEQVLGDVLDRVFNGSTSAVVLKLFEVSSVQDEELKELRRIIDRKLKGE